MNSGFRNLLGKKDTTKFKAYLIAVAVQMILLPPLLGAGVIEVHTPAFYPIAAIAGGLVFGVAMHWGGGCAGGVLYKAGSGSISALVAVVMIIFGYAAAETGILKPLRLVIQSVQIQQDAPELYSPIFQQFVLVSSGAALLIFLLKNSQTDLQPNWSVKKTGILIGLTGVFAWLSSAMSGRFYGMAILPGEKEAFDLLTLSASPGWDLFFVIGIPFGAYISAYRKNEFKWSNITGRSIWRLAGGGFAMGASASLAGGCTVGHSLTGVPLLSFQSLVFTATAISGAVAGAMMNQMDAKKKNHAQIESVI